MLNFFKIGDKEKIMREHQMYVMYKLRMMMETYGFLTDDVYLVC